MNHPRVTHTRKGRYTVSGDSGETSDHNALAEAFEHGDNRALAGETGVKVTPPSYAIEATGLGEPTEPTDPVEPDPEPGPGPTPLPEGFIHGMNMESKWSWDFDKDPADAEHLRPFSLIRAMKWTNFDGLEGMKKSVRLANHLQSDLWICLNPKDGWEAERERLAYVRDNYTGGRLWVAIFNEAWNEGEGFTNWIMQRAGVPNRVGDNNRKFIAEWGKWVKEGWAIAREILPDCVRVLEVFTGNTWNGEQLFAAVEGADYEVVAPTFYVANKASGGVDNIMAEALADASPGSKDYNNLKWYTDQAHAMGKKCVLYEAQQHTNHKSAGSESDAVQAMSYDPRGANVVRRMIQSMQEIGVDGACWFAFKKPLNDKYPFGLLGTPKWAPIVEAAQP